MTIAMALGYPFWSDVGATYTPTFSGGTWSASLPLTNLQDRRLAKVARSSAATLASTQFDLDLKASRRVGIIAIPKHTISTAGKIRFRGWSAVPIFDSLTVGDASWSNTGTPTRSAAAFTRADGIPLDLIGDDDGAATEETHRTVTFTGNGTKAVRFSVAKSSSYAGNAVTVLDVTAGAFRLVANVNFTAATPVVTCPTGTFVSSTARGDGSWDVLCLATGVLAANTNRIVVYPASLLAADTAAFYVGAISAWDAATDQQVYESGLIDVWPIVYPAGSLAAGDPRLVASGGTGKYTAEEAAATNIGFTLMPATVQDARYWRCEIQDTTNAAGYVDLGRLVLADRWVPTIPAAPGVKLGISSATTRTETDGGAFVVAEKTRRRELTFGIEQLTEDESLANAYEMMMRLGTSGQTYVAYDVADTVHRQRRSFLCTMRELTPLEWYAGTRTSVGFALTEEL